MLQSPSKQVKNCYERAAEARRRATFVDDPDIKAELSALELGWLRLAESYALSERINRYLLDQRVDGGRNNKWRSISNAPFDRNVELLVMLSGMAPHALMFPCRRIRGGWIEAGTEERLDVQPILWREWI